MRTIFKTHLMAMALLVALSSCQNLEMDVQPPEPSSPSSELREVIITASIADATSETRTSYNEPELKNYWSPGDKIKVFSAGEAAQFTSLNTVPETIVKFKGNISTITGSSNDDDDSKDYVWGLYPYSEAATYAEPDGISRTARITTMFPDVQVGVAGTFGDNLAVMIGRSESLSIPFRGAYSGAFFQVSRNDIVSMTLKGLNNEVLVGKATIGLNNSLLPVVHEVTDGKTAVTVTAPHGTFETGKNYYIITLPDVALPNGYSVTLRRNDGYEGTYELRANRPLNRIKFRNLSDPVDVRIENAQNIANGVSTGWVQSTTQGINEIWYTSSDGDVVEYTLAAGSDNEIESNVSPNANGGIGIVRFLSTLTEIDEGAFMNKTTLTSVSLPETVEYIGAEAFQECSNLASVNLGSNVNRIEEAAFWGCAFSSISLPEGLEWIGADAFAECANLTEITIPNSVTAIGYDRYGRFSSTPFINCFSLESFYGKYASDDNKCLINDGSLISFATGGMSGETYTIPEGVTRIMNWAFAASLINHVVFPSSLLYIGNYAFCQSSLTDVSIPATVIAVYPYAFSYCSDLQWVKIYKSSTVLGTSSPGAVFDYSTCPIYVPANLLKYYKSEQFWDSYEARYQPLSEPNKILYTTTDGEAVTFNVTSDTGNTLVQSGCKAPKNNGGVGIIQFSAPVTQIDQEALVGNDNLASIILPDSVEDILPGAISECPNLTDIQLGTGLKRLYIDALAFTGITSISLPEGLERIDFACFEFCPLEEVNIPSSVEYIGNRDSAGGFYGSPFNACASLTTFTGKFASADGKCLIKDDGTLVSFATGGMNGQTYTIPSNVTNIARHSFQLSTIKEAILPSGLVEIWPDAFYCSSIERITIPESVLRIDSEVFVNCSLLAEVKMERETPPFLGVKPFMNTHPDLKIWIPRVAMDLYTDMNNYPKWYALKDHFVYYSSRPADNEIWYTSQEDVEVTYTVPSGSTNVLDAANCLTPAENNGIGVISFTEPLTAVDFQAFAISSDHPERGKLTSVILPGGVETIERRAFYGCANLAEVQFGSGLRHIGEQSFGGCGFSTINLPEGLTRLDYAAFSGNSNLTEVTLPESLQYLGYDDEENFFGNPFENTPALTTFNGNFASNDGRCLIYNYNGNDYLMSFATGGMTGANYTVPSGVYGIGGLAFCNTTVKKVVLPDGLTLIADFAFMNSGNLESVNIPATVTSIRTRAFSGCSSLATVHMDGTTPPTLGASAFNNTPLEMEIEIPGAGYMAYATGASNSWASLHLQMVAYQTNQEIWYHNDIADVTDNYDGNFGAYYSTTMTIPGDVLKGFKMNVAPPSTLGDAPSFRIMVFDGPVTSLGDYCFGDDGLYHEPALHVDFVSLPKTVTSIGKGAFKANTKLLQYPVPVGVLTSIGDDAFNGCSSMAGTNINWLGTNSIYTGYSDLELGARAFKGCVGFEEFAGQVTSMGKGAFQGCTNLTKAEVGSMMEIPDSAFYGCNHLEEFVYFRDHLTTIGNYAFRNCYALNLIWNRTSDNQIVGANINASSIGKYAFASCRGITEVKAPGLVTIDEYGFYDCRSIQSITAPSLENIKMYGLGNCYSLASLELPAIKNISNRALSYPRDLALLRLGPNLQFIGDEVFYTINNQTVNGISVTINENQLELYFEGTDLTSSKPNIQIKAFGYQYQNSGQTATYYIPFKFKKIYVPSSALEDYKSKLKARIKVDGADGEYSYWDAGLVEGI